MSRFQKFINDLFTPIVTVREESAPTKRAVSPMNQAILTYVAADIMGGPDTTFMDKATFVATPYVIDAVAQMGAQKGYDESKK